MVINSELLLRLNSEDGGSKFFQHVGRLIQHKVHSTLSQSQLTIMKTKLYQNFSSLINSLGQSDMSNVTLGQMSPIIRACDDASSDDLMLGTEVVSETSANLYFSTPLMALKDFRFAVESFSSYKTTLDPFLFLQTYAAL